MKDLVRFFGAFVATALLVCSCGDYASVEDLNKLESRVAALETLCKQMNTDIASLQTLVSAVQNGDHITGVTPVVQNGVTLGYTIAFAKSPSITIYHGKDGAAGATGAMGATGAQGSTGPQGNKGDKGDKGDPGYSPVIDVRQDVDGIWYWTLDGQWIRDGRGGKLRADGITPKLKIEDGYWYVSYDEGGNWGSPLGPATGADGESLFSDVTVSDTEVTFVLADGRSFSLPLSCLDITFERGDLAALEVGSVLDIQYTVTADTEDIVIETLSSADLKVKVVKTDSKSGTLQIRTGDAVDYEYCKVVVLVSDGTRTILRTLAFAEVLEVTEGAVREISAEGGDLELKCLSNVSYAVTVDADSQSWISEKKTKSLEESDVLLQIAPNEGEARTGSVTLASDHLSVEIIIRQQAATAATETYVVFEDDNFKAYCVEYFDLDSDGEISLEEALAVTKIWEINKTDISSLKGIEYFENLDTLHLGYHYIGYNLDVLDVSQNRSLKYLSCNNTAIAELKLPSSLVVLACQGCGLTELDVRHCPALRNLVCPDNSLTDLDVSQNPELVQLSCKNNLLTRLDLSNHTSLQSLFCNENNLAELNIKGCEALYVISCTGSGLRSLDVSECPALEQLRCSGNYLTLLDVSNNPKLRVLRCDSQYVRPLALWLKTGQEIEDFQYDESMTTILRK